MRCSTLQARLALHGVRTVPPPAAHYIHTKLKLFHYTVLLRLLLTVLFYDTIYHHTKKINERFQYNLNYIGIRLQ